MNIEEKIREFKESSKIYKESSDIYRGFSGRVQYVDSKVINQAEILEELLERIVELERLAQR